MTDRTDVQANCIGAYAAKTGTTDKSVTPTVVSEFLQVLADNAAMSDEVVSSAVNTNNIGFTLAVERSGNLIFQQRAIGSRGFNGDNRTNISGGGFLPGALVGDKISVWVASSATTTVTVHDANLGINLRAPSSLVT